MIAIYDYSVLNTSSPFDTVMPIAGPAYLSGAFNVARLVSACLIM